MDIKSLLARIKSISFSKKPAAAAPAVAADVKKSSAGAGPKKRAVMAGLLAIAVVGGALYLFGYQLEEPSPTPAAPPPVVRKPQPAPAQAAAKPATPQPAAPAPAPSVPAVAAPKPQPVVAQAPGAPATAPEMTAKAATPEPVAQKPEPKKNKAAAKRRQVAKSEQAAKPEPVAKLDSKVDGQDTQQAPTKPQDVLLKPAYPPAEPAPVVPPEPITPAEPAPMPAPDEPVVPPPVESAMGAPAPRGAITPKYNDVMTAVLRGDKDAAKELLDLGWWVDKPSESGVTPLMAAVMNRDAEMVQLLLDYGAEPTSQALRLARKNKDNATASLLEQKGAR